MVKIDGISYIEKMFPKMAFFFVIEYSLVVTTFSSVFQILCEVDMIFLDSHLLIININNN